jgi:hypothetical protein
MTEYAESIHWLLWDTHRTPASATVLTDANLAAKARELGREIDGPFYPQGYVAPSCVECPVCSTEVDTRTARRL